MATSTFNLGTAIGTWITGLALDTALGALAPAVVGTFFAILIFLPLGALTVLEHRARPAGLQVGVPGARGTPGR